MSPLIAVAAVAVVAHIGCFAPPVPDGLLLTCSEDAECPEPLTCRALGSGEKRCVSAADLERPPPEVLASTVTPADVIRPGETLTATLRTASELADSPAVTFGALALTLANTTRDGDDTEYTFTADLGDDAIDGAFTVSAVLVDVLGTRAQATLGDGPVRVDATPPAVVAASVAVALVDPTDVVAAPLALSATGVATISFSVTEPLSVAPVVAVAGVAATLAADAAPAFVYVINGVELAALADGAHDITVALVDAAGNESAAETIATIALDVTPPDPLDAAALASVVYQRRPWGRIDDPAAARDFSVVAEPPLATDGVVRVLDDTGVELARTAIASLDTIALGQIDRARVFLQLVDTAGNVSPVQQVTHVRWVANLRGKVAGSSLGNPHRLLLRGADGLAPLPETSLGDEVNGALVDQVDGVSATVNGGPSLRLLDDRLPDPTPAAVVVDRLRGEVVAFNQNGSVDAWTGARWRAVDVTDFELDGAPTGNALLAAFDARRGVAVIQQNFADVAAQLWEFDGRAHKKRGEAGEEEPIVPFVATQLGFDGRGIVGVRAVTDGADTRVQAWRYDGSDTVVSLCTGAACPIADVQGVLRLVDGGPAGLLVADRRFGPDRFAALLRIVDGALVSCAADCPLDGAVGEPMQDVAYDGVRDRWVAVRPFAQDNAVVTSPDGRAPWTTICADDATCGISAVGARALHRDPLGGGVLLRDRNFALSLVESARVKQLFRVDPCEILGCSAPTPRVPTARLPIAFAPEVGNVMGFESVTDATFQNDTRVLELAGSAWIARDPPPFLFSPLENAALVTLEDPIGGGGAVMVMGEGGATNRYVPNGTAGGWFPGQPCPGVVNAIPPIAALSGIGPVHVGLTETRAMEFEPVNGNWPWVPICSGACHPDFTSVVAVTADEDAAALHALAYDDTGCASFWEFDGAAWTQNPLLALCEEIPLATMFPAEGHVYAIVGPDKLVDATDGTILSISDPEGDGPARVQLQHLTATYDPRLERTVLAGDGAGIDATPVLTDTMVFEPGSGGRASALFQVLFSEAGAVGARLDRIAVAVHSGVPNLTVAVFDGDKDAQLSRAAPDDPLYVADGGGDALARYVTGSPPSLLVRVRNGDVSPSAAVAIDAIEAVLDYTEVLP